MKNMTDEELKQFWEDYNMYQVDLSRIMLTPWGFESIPDLDYEPDLEKAYEKFEKENKNEH